MKYKHIIWDWNGTLLDDTWLCLKVLNIQTSRRRLPLVKVEKYKQTFGYPIRAHYEAHGFDFSTEDFKDVNTEFIAEYESRREWTTLRRGTIDTLAKIQELAISQSILSALHHDLLVTAIARFDIKEFFFAIRGMNNRNHAGKADAGLKLIDDIGVCPEKILYIGDVIGDYIATKEMGIDCILISGTQSLERLRSTGARVIRSFSELYPVLNVRR